MATIHVGKSVGTQLKAGAAILAAARTVDTRLIKDRLAAFAQAHQVYANADAKVQQAEVEFDKVHAQFRTQQHTVVDALARALLADGQPLRNAFTAFGGATPGGLLRLGPDDAVKALPELIAAIRRSKTLGKTMLQAVQGAEKSVRGLEQALGRMQALRTTEQDARAGRDAVGQTWEVALGALKRGARAAADEGAPTLYATLFDRPTRSSAKAAKPAPAPSPAPTSSPAAVPTPQPERAAS